MTINLSYVIIGLLLLNTGIVLVSESKRRKLSIKLAKEGNESIKDFVSIFKQLDGKLKVAVEVMGKAEEGHIVESANLSFYTNPMEKRLEEIKEKIEVKNTMAKNIESYISMLKYARDNFAQVPTEKKVVNSLIKNIENQYGKSRSVN